MDSPQLTDMNTSTSLSPLSMIDRRQFITATLAGLGAYPSMKAIAADEKKTASLATIVVTTPTGAIGSRMLQPILDRGVPIRLIARDPSKIPTAIRERAEVVEGSHGDPEIVNRAFKGAETVFWVCPPDPTAASVEAAYSGFSGPACEAIKRHGIKRVVTISALGRGTPMAAKAGYVTGSLAMDDLIMRTGVSFRALTMPSFMENLLRQTESIASDGVFRLPIDGDRKVPSCAVNDIAGAAVRLLLDPSWSGQSSVAVLGPEDISANDMARVMSEVLGKPIRYEQISIDRYKAILLQNGMSEAMALGVTEMWMAKNEGLDNAEPRTPENTTPTTFRQWCESELKPEVMKLGN